MRTVATEAIWSVNHVADQVLRDLYIKGQGTNITCQSYKGRLLIDNVVSVDAWRSDQFGGQGLFCDQIAGEVTIQNSMFAFSGRPRPPAPPGTPQTPTPYKHDQYLNASIGRLTVAGCILAQAANAGVQTRCMKGSLLQGNVFLDCATAVLAIEGGATLEDNIIFGGQFYYDGHGLTANTGLRSFWPAILKNNYFITRPGQGTPPLMPIHPGVRAFPQGAINMGGWWVHEDPPFTPPDPAPTEFILPGSAGNYVSKDWPGGLFAGPTTGVSFSELPGPRSFDYLPIIAEIEKGMDVAQGIAAIRAALIPKVSSLTSH